MIVWQNLKEMKNGTRWAVIDCVTKKSYELSGSECRLGTNGECLLARGKRDGAVVVRPGGRDAPLFANGVRVTKPETVPVGQECFIRAGEQFYLLKGGEGVGPWMERLNLDRWILQDVNRNQIIDTVPFERLSDRLGQLQTDPNAVITTVEGAEHGMFVRDAFPNAVIGADGNSGPHPIPARPPTPKTALQPSDVAGSAGDGPGGAGETDGIEEVEINTVSGEFTCPHCWQHFDRGDVMWIARHPSLRDPDLGDEYPLRFFPTSFDELGRAIDGMGARCSDMACPNCKTRLPPQFLDLPAHIFSIVGAPSAGKSYFLTSMINQLEERLPARFGLSFQDGDASGNALLSYMRARLFSDSSDPAEIALDKTVPGGEMFRTWSRDGRTIKLPKPFTYLLAPFGGDDDGRESLQLVFYDNAGEQFEPAERSEAAESTDEDATRHLASSDTIFFLYDPATNVRFRKKLTNKSDPQVSDEKYLKLNRQDNIIAEMRIRIKSELYFDAGEKLDSPLVMIVGKCDLWADLLDGPLVDPITPDGLSLDAVARNSDLIRQFLLETSPGVVGNAEAISREVVYFPVSPIGHSPQPFSVPGGDDERIGPVPGKVDPLYVEAPVIWSLARLHPELIRTTTEAAAAAEET